MTYSLKRTHNVFGIVVYEEHTDAILSGDQGAGFKFDSYVSALKASTLRVLSHVPEGTHLSPEVQIREMMGSEDAKFLSATGVKLSGDLLVLTPNKYRVGRGGVFVNLAFPGFEMGGEILETSLQVAVGISSTPPPVVSDADVFADISVDGSAVFQVNMFNAQNWKEMKATVGATVFTADREISAMGEVDQKITFRASSASEGVYKMKLSVVDEAGKQVNAILLHDTKVTMRAELGDAASAGSGNVDGKAVDVVAIVVGCVVGLLVVVGLAGALVAVWSRRQSEDDSESFAPSMGSEAFGGVDIARDVYGRGSVSFMEREEARFDGV